MGRPIVFDHAPRQAQIAERICAQCGDLFTPKRGATLAKYCSTACRKLAASAQATAMHAAKKASGIPNTKTERPKHPFVVATDEAEALVRQVLPARWREQVRECCAEIGRLRGRRFAAIVEFALCHRLKLAAA
jgi:hypothetical protein